MGFQHVLKFGEALIHVATYFTDSDALKRRPLTHSEVSKQPAVQPDLPYLAATHLIYLL